eukprot:contig_16909_g4109
MLGDTADARYVGVKLGVEAAKVRLLAASLLFASDMGATAAATGTTAPVAKRCRRGPPLGKRHAAAAANATAEGAAPAYAARHVLIVDDATAVATFDAASPFDASAPLLGRPSNQVRADDAAAGRMVLTLGGATAGAAASREEAVAYKKLAACAKRVAKLEVVRGDVELIKRLRGKGATNHVWKRNTDTSAPAVTMWWQLRSK